MGVIGLSQGLVLPLGYALDNAMITSTTTTLTGLANHLVYEGLLEQAQARQAWDNAKATGIPFISYLVKNNIVTSNIILDSCAKHFGLTVFDLNEYDLSWLTHSHLNQEWIHRYHVIPLQKNNNVLQIAISDPTDRQALDAITFYTGLVISPFLVAEDQLSHFIEVHFSNLHSKNLQLNFLKDMSYDEDLAIIQENSVSYDEPVIRFVDHIIQHALHQGASDIHIEPYETICRIRYRKDGILYIVAEIPVTLASRLITRLKVMSKLDITERRLPQDGRFQVHQADIRINTCPTLFGEKIVLRLLHAKTFHDINEFGLTDAQKNIFIKKISQPQGLILVTGPTGSGKTVTLYSALNYLNTAEKNISTIEDPIEIQLKGINQLNINPKINLHFSTALRTFLRQDPDIIMVGEIRDSETAEIAIQAAQTGHLVLATLHTNSAVETISRLRSMGIAPYNIISSISLIVAQRLVRKLCEHCKQPEIISAQGLTSLGFDYPQSATFYKAQGCQHCLQGYQGRIGIYEMLAITEPIMQLIMAEESSFVLRARAKQDDFYTLRDAGLEKALQGITSLTEINRVIYQ